MKSIILYITLSIFLITNLKAQNLGTIRGKIIDDYSKTNLENVQISIQKSSIETRSNKDGTFTINNAPLGKRIFQLSFPGFYKMSIPVEITGDRSIDLGIIRLTEKTEREKDNSFISLSDVDLDENEKGESNTITGVLVASKDVFSKTIAYEFSTTFFKPRNLGSEHISILLNGVKMNKMFNGRPQWSNWGGMNDVLRNQTPSLNMSLANNSFDNIGGTTDISTLSSKNRKGIKISYASSNRSYQGRVMATFNSGFTEKGWAYSVSSSFRYAAEGFRKGTLYNSKSFFISIDKKIKENQLLNLTAIYASNIRGKSSPITQEVFELKNIKYNAYWGDQQGEIRNSRIKKLVEPIIQLNYNYKINETTNLQSSVTYQFGSIGSSRIDYGGTGIVINDSNNQSIIGGGSNPDPTYYQKLPSYFLRNSNNPDYANAFLAEQEFLKNGQVKWEELYEANGNNVINNGSSIYALYEDRNDDKQISINANFSKRINNKINIYSGVGFRKLKSENFANMLDLLGGNGYLDVDVYANSNTEAQSDLQNKNRIIIDNERFKYNFLLHASELNTFLQSSYSTKKMDFFIALNLGQVKYQREGLFENGVFPGKASLGTSEEISLINYGIKGGFTYKYSGRHIFEIHAAYLTKAPTLQNSFSNPRENNDIVIDLSNEKITSFDLSYFWRHPKVNAKITGYWINLRDQTDISFYFADGLTGINQKETTAFVQEVLSDISKQNLGLEISLDFSLFSGLKLKAVAAVGQSTYNKNPNLYLTSDDFKQPVNLGKVYLKNYFVSGGPQQAYSFGFEYSSPNYWWFGSTINYFNKAYISIAPITRTKNFYLDTDGLPITDFDEEIAKKLLKQEKFNPYFLINFVGGKSWKIKNKYIGFFANVSNILNTTYKTGGFEQSRNANYTKLLEDRTREKPLFGPKYWFGYGASYYASVYLRL